VVGISLGSLQRALQSSQLGLVETRAHRIEVALQVPRDAVKLRVLDTLLEVADNQVLEKDNGHTDHVLLLARLVSQAVQDFRDLHEHVLF